MTLFPFFEDIDGKTFLVVGGGAVAKGKVEKLRAFTDNITVVAPESDIDGYIRKAFAESDLDAADYVIAATDDHALNARIYRLCRQKQIPVNTVDDPALCTFVFPSLIKKGDLTVGITTGGKSPLTAQYLRAEIENLLPAEIDSIIDEMGRLKEKLKTEIPDRTARAEILKAKLAELLQ